MRLNLPLVLRSWLLLFSSRRLLSFWQFANNILVGLYRVCKQGMPNFLSLDVPIFERMSQARCLCKAEKRMIRRV
jgi:hypothetical protein